jgi:hypothetical protein
MTKTKTAEKGKATRTQFRQDSKEFKKLLKLFKDGKIKSTDQPASIRSKYIDVFEKFTATQFRSQFHKARQLAGINGTCITSDSMLR